MAQAIFLVGWSRDGLRPVVPGTTAHTHLTSCSSLLVWLRLICWAEVCGTGLASPMRTQGKSSHDLKLTLHLARPAQITAWLVVQVICLDNFFTGCKENVMHLIGMSDF